MEAQLQQLSEQLMVTQNTLQAALGRIDSQTAEMQTMRVEKAILEGRIEQMSKEKTRRNKREDE